MPRIKILQKKAVEPETRTIVLGGVELEIQKTSARNGAKALRVLEPYITEIATEIGRLWVQPEVTGEGERTSTILTAILSVDVLDLLKKAPEDFLALFCYLINATEDVEAGDTNLWEIVHDSDMGDIFEAWPVVLELNDFGGLFAQVRDVFTGILQRYTAVQTAETRQAETKEAGE